MASPMTAPFAALRKVVAQATPGPWRLERLIHHERHPDLFIQADYHCRGETIALMNGPAMVRPCAALEADATLIVALRNAIEPLLRVVDRAEAVVAAIDYTTGIDADDWAHIRVEARALRAALEEAGG